MPLRAEYPEEGELVVGTVTSIRNFGAFVTLDEYNGREAFIHLSEVATGWVKVHPGPHPRGPEDRRPGPPD